MSGPLTRVNPGHPGYPSADRHPTSPASRKPNVQRDAIHVTSDDLPERRPAPRPELVVQREAVRVASSSIDRLTPDPVPILRPRTAHGINAQIAKLSSAVGKSVVRIAAWPPASNPVASEQHLVVQLRS